MRAPKSPSTVDNAPQHVVEIYNEKHDVPIEDWLQVFASVTRKITQLSVRVTASQSLLTRQQPPCIVVFLLRIEVHNLLHASKQLLY